MSEILEDSVFLAVGGLLNLILVLSLKHTWRYWTQVKWYVLLMAVGNWVEVLFMWPVRLGVQLTNTWVGGDLSCKPLSLMAVLGPNVASMAVAALSVHVLLTAITGCHGNRLRHGLVIGLFLLLSLPFPVSKILVYGVKTTRIGDKELAVCSDFDFFRDPDDAHLRFYYFIAGSIALVFFPLVVIVGAGGGALMFQCTASRGTVKSESNAPNLVLTVLLGLVLMVFCVPLLSFIFYFQGRYSFDTETMHIYKGLNYLSYSRVIISALVCVVFGYAHVYRKGRQDDERAVPAGERQQLVK